MSKIVYSGEKLRKFFSNRKITHLDAAEFLGVDRYILGKAICGGNINISVLLTICNKYDMSINDFFVREYDEKDNFVYNNTLKEIITDPAAIYPIMRMGIGNIPECRVIEEYETIISAQNDEIALLKEMNKLYKERITEMEKILLQHGLSYNL